MGAKNFRIFSLKCNLKNCLCLMKYYKIKFIMLKIDNMLIVGNPENFHVGSHFYKAAQNIGLKAEIIDVRDAFGSSKLFQSALWKFGGKKPQKLKYFWKEGCCLL